MQKQYWPNDGEAVLAARALETLCRDLEVRLKEVLAEAQALRADAERYWWLRSGNVYRKAVFSFDGLSLKCGYQANGTVVTEFITLAGAKQVVFEFDEPSGMLHIFNHEQVVRDER